MYSVKLGAVRLVTGIGAWFFALCAAGSMGAAQVGDTGQGCPSIDGLYFVDSHSQMDEGVDEARVLSLMDHGGVYRTLLSNHLRRSPESLRAFAKSAPDRIIPMLRAKDIPQGWDVAASWRDGHRAELATGAYRGIAEMLVWHQGEPELRIREVRFELDDAVVRSAFDVARERGWPFIVHIEFGSLEGEARKRYMGELESLAAQDPQVPIVMIHMGQLPPDDVSRLIDLHPNLYFMTSHSNPISSQFIKVKKRWQNLFEGRQISARWRDLFVTHPDRFVFALDNVFSGNWVPRMYLGQMALWWCALSQLPAPVAHAIAHGNSERLWRLPPKPGEIRALTPWAASVELGPVIGEATGRGVQSRTGPLRRR